MERRERSRTLAVLTEGLSAILIEGALTLGGKGGKEFVDANGLVGKRKKNRSAAKGAKGEDLFWRERKGGRGGGKFKNLAEGKTATDLGFRNPAKGGGGEGYELDEKRKGMGIGF